MLIPSTFVGCINHKNSSFKRNRRRTSDAYLQKKTRMFISFMKNPDCFGYCPYVDENDDELADGITSNSKLDEKYVSEAQKH